MTLTQQRMIQRIKDKLNHDIEAKNERFNTNCSVVFEESENEYFAVLRSYYQYNAERSNPYTDESMQIFIFKRGRIEGVKRTFGNEYKIKELWQISIH